ncbi:uncharacterized protein DSM5745_09656 [Aspergillus mulundensis]|uniref:Nephrocystin 3-like N-terminal domain-containing protein n=1 Tax=Aspergillus mulundensis TaxID=1810919 RepID=A0A3D8QVW2_9EURO|nr:hypothetical protein DSM5745_09656 [Aspergillus mulundensis]RDW65917.1 hypothetical protein DSM5745_09656 [Aspergillus mulundensis]
MADILSELFESGLATAGSPWETLCLMLDHADDAGHEIKRLLDAPLFTCNTILFARSHISLKLQHRKPEIIDEMVEAKHCLESLYFPEWQYRGNTVEKPRADTCAWVWTHPAFVRWQAQPGGILWIKGKPGSGKSTIAKMITGKISGHLTRHDNGQSPPRFSTANFFYSARMGEKATRHYYMLRSILYQVLDQDRSVYRHFKASYRRLLAKQLPWTMEDFREVLQSVTNDCCGGHRRICCILDGFDEADEEEDSGSVSSRLTKTQVLQWLAELAVRKEQGSWMKLIVLSRPVPSIARVLGRNCITVEEHNAPDIKHLISTGFASIQRTIDDWDRHDYELLPDGSPGQPSESQDTLASLKSEMRKKACGTIQWVVLVLKELQAEIDRRGVYSRAELEDIVASLPSGLHELYQELVTRLQRRLRPVEVRKANLMLSWVCFSHRPLALMELRDALALDGWTDSKPRTMLSEHLKSRRLQLSQTHNWAPVEREILHCCGCLLEVVKVASSRTLASVRSTVTGPHDIVQVAHHSVKEFLLQETGAPEPFRLLPDEAYQSHKLSRRPASFGVCSAGMPTLDKQCRPFLPADPPAAGATHQQSRRRPIVPTRIVDGLGIVSPAAFDNRPGPDFLPTLHRKHLCSRLPAESPEYASTGARAPGLCPARPTPALQLLQRREKRPSGSRGHDSSIWGEHIRRRDEGRCGKGVLHGQGTRQVSSMLSDRRSLPGLLLTVLRPTHGWKCWERLVKLTDRALDAL